MFEESESDQPNVEKFVLGIIKSLNKQAGRILYENSTVSLNL